MMKIAAWAGSARQAATALGLVLGLAGMAAATGTASPAAKMYDELQAIRHRHDKALYGPSPVAPEALRSALHDLDAGLALMQSERFHDLSFGSINLAARRMDFLIDKTRARFRLGDRTGALSTWRELLDVAWVPVEVVTQGDPEMSAWLSQSSPPDLQARTRALQHLSTPDRGSATPQALTPAERIERLSVIWHLARQNFVWFDHVPDLDWDRAYRDALPRVIAAPDDVAYWRELMRFAALLRDGHSNAYPPESLWPQFYARPGIGTQRIEGRVLVTEVRDRALIDKIRRGDEVVAIDGQPVDAYVEQHVRPFQSSSTPQDLEVRSYSYALLTGADHHPVTLTLKHEDGRLETVQAPRSGYQTIDAAPRDVFTLREDGIAVLIAGQFEDDEALKALESRLADLQRAKGLVIDLRGNGGGSTDNGTRILWHLTKTALPQARARVRVRREESSPFVYWHPLTDAPQAPSAQAFDGPVAMLVDAQTFSAAEDTAAVFKMMQRGPIIGAPTGGSTGQPLLRSLPGGGMVRVCSKRDSYADGSDFVGVGVLPDIVVRPTIDALRQRRDPAMEQALAAMQR